jgi:regulator of sigma D
MTNRFDKAYNALYNGFMNGTLAKGTCHACAVGNMVADAMDAKIYYDKENSSLICNKDNAFWGSLFATSIFGKQTRYYLDLEFFPITNNYIKKVEKLTEYSVDELCKIEYAFETNTQIHHVYYDSTTEQEVMEDQFNGLMAVMDVLIELDNIEEGTKYKETFKTKFHENSFC